MVTRDPALAEDLVSTAFLKAYDRIGQFDMRRPFGPWFLRIVVNDAKNALASKNRDLSLDAASPTDEPSLSSLTDVGPSLEELAEQSEARYAVGAALTKLSPKQREAVVLHYYLGLGQAEVATRLGKSVVTVKEHLHNARGRLRSMLSGKVGND